MSGLVTGEAAVLDVRVARPPTRVVALALDVFLQLATMFLLALLVSRVAGATNTALARAVELTLFVLVVVGYPTTIETLWRGRSLGKAAMGLRVVGEDGGPERFRQALLRALAGVVEIWLLLGTVALISSLLSERGRRLGDVFAGTLVIKERMPTAGAPTAATAPVAMPPPLAGWAAGLQLSELSDEQAMTVRRFLTRYHELAAGARERMGARIAADVAERVSPPPPPDTPPEAFLRAVLAERRRREEQRLGTETRPDPGKEPGRPPGRYEPPPPPHAAPAPHEQPTPSAGQQREPHTTGDGQSKRSGGFAPPG